MYFAAVCGNKTHKSIMTSSAVSTQSANLSDGHTDRMDVA